MYDFKIENNGELSLIENDIGTVSEDNLKFQKALCVLMSVTENWFNDKNFGANIEEIIGMDNSKSTINIGKSKIISAITNNNIYKENEIHVESNIIDNTILEYKIFFKKSDGISAKLLTLSLDIVKGCDITIGGALWQ